MDLSLIRDAPFSSPSIPPTPFAFHPSVHPTSSRLSLPPFLLPNLATLVHPLEPLADVLWPSVVWFASGLVSSEWEAKRDSWMGSVAGGVLPPGKHFCSNSQSFSFIHILSASNLQIPQ